MIIVAREKTSAGQWGKPDFHHVEPPVRGKRRGHSGGAPACGRWAHDTVMMGTAALRGAGRSCACSSGVFLKWREKSCLRWVGAGVGEHVMVAEQGSETRYDKAT